MTESDAMTQGDVRNYRNDCSECLASLSEESRCRRVGLLGGGFCLILVEEVDRICRVELTLN